MNYYNEEALDVSGFQFIAGAPQTAWFAFVQWVPREVLALGDSEVRGQYCKLRNLHFKKCRNIKDSHYFWGNCTPDLKNLVLIHGSVSPFLETSLEFEAAFSCSSVIADSYAWVPAKPNHQVQAGNFPTSRVAWGSLRKWEWWKLPIISLSLLGSY